MDSILTSIKKLLGIDKEYTHFDADIIMHINDALFVLTQLGVGPPEGFRIDDDTAIWSDFIPANDENYDSVRTYVHKKVRLAFDTPQGSVLAAVERQASELEWRMNVAAETPTSNALEGVRD